MTEDFYASFDSSLSTDIPSAVPPDTITRMGVDNTSYIVGGGSLTCTHASQSGLLIWDGSFSATHRNVGQIVFWHRAPQSGGNARVDYSRPASDAEIELRRFINSPAGYNSYNLTMRNAIGGPVISVTGTLASLSSNWQRIRLLWRWNDPSGYTALYQDDELVILSTLGNTQTRALGVVNTRVILGLSPDGNMDEFYVWDSLAPRKLTLGAPLGVPNTLGR